MGDGSRAWRDTSYESFTGVHQTGTVLKGIGFATLERVDWFNHRRLLEPIGNIPPAEAEARYHAAQEATPHAA